MDNNQPENIKKSSNIKKILGYILPIYISIIVLFGILILVIANIHDGFDALGYLLIFGAVIMAATGILSIVLTIIFINKNFTKQKSIFPIKVLINSVSAYVMCISFAFLISIILTIINNSDNTISRFFPIIIFISPLFYPLFIIPISCKLNKKYKLSKKAVYILLGILSLLYLILNFRINLMTFIYIYALIVAIIPAFVSSWAYNKNIDDNKSVKKNYIKEICILTGSIILCIGISFIPVDSLLKKTNEVMAIPNQKTINDYIYGITPYKTKNNDIYYHAYNTADYSSSEEKNLYYVNKNDLSITARVNKIYTVYNFDSKTDNIYYTLNHAGPLYELNSDGKSTNIIKSSNPSVDCYNNNFIYYMDYVKNKTQKININTYEISDFDSEINNAVLIANDKYIYYQGENEVQSGSRKVNRYDTVTGKTEVFTGDNFDDLYWDFRNGYMKDDILYYLSDERNTDKATIGHYLCMFDLNTTETTKDKVIYHEYKYNNDDIRITGIFDDNLYYVSKDDYGKYKICQINLKTFNAEIIFETRSDFFGFTQEYQKSTAAKRVFENTVIRDNYLYYSNYNSNNNGKLYRINLTNQTHEQINNDENSIFFDVIDGYIYYTTNDFYNGKSGFYRVRNMNREVIIE